MPRSEDGYQVSGGPAPAAGNVTLSQAQFDMLCNKLHGLENSITELRNEISRNSQGRASGDLHDPKMYAPRLDEAQANGQPLNGEAKAPQVFQRHAAKHGIHAKNEQVRIPFFRAALRSVV